MPNLKSILSSENGPSVATIIFAVGTSLMFCLGFFLVLNAQNSNQAHKLEETIAAIKKSQEEGIDLSTALAGIRSGDEDNSSKPSDPGPVNALFDTLTVKDTTTLQGAVKATRDVSIGGSLAIKNNATIQGDVSTQGNLAVGGDASMTNLTSTGSATIGGDVAVQGSGVFNALNVTGDTSLSGNLQVADTMSTDTLQVAGATSVLGTLEVKDSVSVARSLDVAGSTTLRDMLEVSGRTALQDTLDVQGAVTLNGASLTPGTATLSVQGETTFNGGADALTVTGATIFDGSSLPSGTATLSITGAGVINGTGLTPGTAALAVQGSVTITGPTATIANPNPVALDVDGLTTINGGLEIGGTTVTLDAVRVTGGNATVQSNALSGNIVVGSIESGSTVSGSPNVTSTNTISVGTVTGSLSLGDFSALQSMTGGVLSVTNTVNGNLTVNTGGPDTGVTFGGTTTINATSVSLNTLSATDETINFNAGVSLGTMTHSGDITGSVNVSGGLTMNGDLTIGDAELGGLTTGGNVSISGVLYALGQIQVNDGSNYYTGLDVVCPAGKHISISTIREGIVTAVNGGGNPCLDGVDYAEIFPSVQQLTPGEVVSIDVSHDEHIVRTQAGNDQKMIGIVSTNPGYTLGEDKPGYAVALAGRVPVKVTNEGGAIAPGDYITSASRPGYAKKAAAGEKTIGQALAAFDASEGTVIVFVNTGGGNLPSQELLQSTQTPVQSDNTSFSSLNVSGMATLKDLTVTGTASVANLDVTGHANVADLAISGHVIGNEDTRGTITIPAGEQVIHKDFLKPYTKAPVLVASPVSDAVLYSVTTSATGFDIKLKAPVTGDTIFNYVVQE